MTTDDLDLDAWEHQTFRQGYLTGHKAGYLKALKDMDIQLKTLGDRALEIISPILPPPYDQSVMAVATKPITEHDFSARTLNCLRHEEIGSLEELATWSKARLLSIPHFGPKSLKEVIEKLAEVNLSLQSSSERSLPKR